MAGGAYARLDEPGHPDRDWDNRSRAHLFQLLALERAAGVSLGGQSGVRHQLVWR